MASMYRYNKSQAYIVTIGGNEYFFSYATCIAFRGTHDGQYKKVRLKNHWGRTTGRHFNQLGAKDFEVVTREQLEAITG